MPPSHPRQGVKRNLVRSEGAAIGSRRLGGFGEPDGVGRGSIVSDDGQGVRLHRDLPDGIGRLVEAGLDEGFPFVERLVREWHSGANRFDAPGEVFLGVHEASELRGFGGLNVDPYCAEPGVGRVRHLYVEPGARGRGLGAALVRELVRRAAPRFERLRLRTRHAGAFYESLGFVRVDEPDATHVLELVGSPVR